MEGALGRLYERLGPRYVVTWMGGGTALAVCGLGLPALGCLALLVPMSAARFFELCGVQVVLSAAILAIVLRRTRPERRTLGRWLASGRPAGDAEATWRAVAKIPVRYSQGVLAVMPGLAVVGAVYAGARLDLSAGETAAVGLGAELVTIATAMLSLFWGELLLRPVLKDVARALPSDFTLARAGIPLRRKMLIVLMIIGFGGGAAVAGVSAGTDASLETFTRNVLIAVGVSATLVLGLTLLVADSLMAPIVELLAATRRIAGGDLSARAPVFSDDELGALTSSFNAMMDGLVEREQLQTALGSYVSPHAAQRILAEGSLLVGEEVEVTVLFIDIRDFTSFAERSGAHEVVATLNEFFELVVPVITAHGGYPNKLLGDGLLVVFGAPESLADHAGRAVDAARELAVAIDERYGPGGLRVGIGLHSGPVVAGTIGWGEKLDFTVIGDTVNVASRVEALTRQTGDVVLVTDATRARVDGAVHFAERGAMDVKGRSEPVRVFTPV